MLHIQRQLWRGKKWGKGQKESSCVSVCRKKNLRKLIFQLFFPPSHSSKHFPSHSLSVQGGDTPDTIYPPSCSPNPPFFSPRTNRGKVRRHLVKREALQDGGPDAHGGACPVSHPRNATGGIVETPRSRDISRGSDAQRPLATQACTTSAVPRVTKKGRLTRSSPEIIKPRRLRRLHADTGLSSAKALLRLTHFRWPCCHLLTVAPTHHALPSLPPNLRPRVNRTARNPHLAKEMLLVKAVLLIKGTTLPPSLQYPSNFQHP
uniref:Uncharacterized protein n=1 Tax=Rhipicephalus zambeziensis TaxID=60191 RepID=A0A224YAU9_9ACAR